MNKHTSDKYLVPGLALSIIVLGLFFISNLKGDAKLNVPERTAKNNPVHSEGIILKHGFIDRKGQFIIPPIYDYASEFNAGISVASKKLSSEPNNSDGELKYHLDISGKVLRSWRNSSGAHWEKVNTTAFGDTIRPGNDPIKETNHYLKIAKEDDIPSTQEESSRVTLRGQWFKPGKWGFKDELGAWIIAPKWDYVSNFDQGSAFVMIEHDPKALKGDKSFDKWGLIDTKGHYLLQPLCVSITKFTDNRARCQVAITNK